MDSDSTQIIVTPRDLEVVLDERVHCLEQVEGPDFGHRYVIPPTGATIGRIAPCDIIFADPEVSRTHCRLDMRGAALVVTDLNSTNGVFIDGLQVAGSSPLSPGEVLRIGRQHLKYGWSTRREILQANQLDRDLESASAYVRALLPPPLTEGPIRANWLHLPSAKLGGDAFGYAALNEHQFLVYIIDVSGHGAGAAMHSVAVINVLRQRALPNTDMSDPGAVLSALNAMFQMEQHADMYFTMWCGVFDSRTRVMDFACGGHHPAFMIPADRSELTPLDHKNGLIGAVPGKIYTAGSINVPAGSSIYLFSDGVFEIVTMDNLQWALKDFLPLILKPPADGLNECQRLYREVTAVARPGGFDDDFSLVVLTFD